MQALLILNDMFEPLMTLNLDGIAKWILYLPNIVKCSLDWPLSIISIQNVTLGMAHAFDEMQFIMQTWDMFQLVHSSEIWIIYS
jgi:hypothetical protein